MSKAHVDLHVDIAEVQSREFRFHSIGIGRNAVSFRLKQQNTYTVRDKKQHRRGSYREQKKSGAIVFYKRQKQRKSETRSHGWKNIH